MSKGLNLTSIVEAYVRAAQEREPTSHTAWNYGWSQASYRHSGCAAMTGNQRQSVRLSASAVLSFEEATSALLDSQEIRCRYDCNEIWSLAASMIGALPIGVQPDQYRQAIVRWVETVLKPPDSAAIFAIANVSSLKTPLDFGPLLLGHSDDAFRRALAEKVGRELLPRPTRDVWWISELHKPWQSTEARTLLLAYHGRSQLNQAITEAEEAFENLISIALMLQEDLDALSLYSLRVDANRPGLRGLVPDRQSLMRIAETLPLVSREISCPIVVDGIFGQTTTMHWYSEAPFPLEHLLSEPEKRAIAKKLLFGSTAVDHRFRVAARWHAKAHWSLELTDAVLALGISFESMLGEKSPSPGRVLSERFALVEPNPDRRRDRYRLFQSEYYPARSSIAHGATRESLNTEFMRGMARQARWTFRRILGLTEAFKVESEDEYNKMWESLKWDAPNSLATPNMN